MRCWGPLLHLTLSEIREVIVTVIDQSLWSPPPGTLGSNGSRSNPYNVVMVGNSSVGKTSFMKRFQSGEFCMDHYATIGEYHYPICMFGTMPFHVVWRNKHHGTILLCCSFMSGFMLVCFCSEQVLIPVYSLWQWMAAQWLYSYGILQVKKGDTLALSSSQLVIVHHASIQNLFLCSGLNPSCVCFYLSVYNYIHIRLL